MQNNCCVTQINWCMHADQRSETPPGIKKPQWSHVQLAHHSFPQIQHPAHNMSMSGQLLQKWAMQQQFLSGGELYLTVQPSPVKPCRLGCLTHNSQLNQMALATSMVAVSCSHRKQSFHLISNVIKCMHKSKGKKERRPGRCRAACSCVVGADARQAYQRRRMGCISGLA
jgi:hypothetical protein